MSTTTAAAPPRIAGAAPPKFSPALPLAFGLAVAPVAAVLQSKALAPIALLALAGCVLRHRQRHGAWPWPRRGPLLWAGLALFAWGAASALWAAQPLKALGTSLQIGGFFLLGTAACRAVAEDDEAAKRRLMLAACFGLAAGLALAGLDALTGNAVRAAVRGLKEAPPHLHFGLKPAASAMALWLPLAAAVPGLSRAWRGVVLAGGAAVVLSLPGETPKIAVLAAAAAGAAALLAPRAAPRLLGAALAASILLMPAALGPVLARGVPADGIAPSAAHRLLIWDFVAARVAERPLLGWGMEGSRAVPGRDANPSPEALARFNLATPAASRWELLPLHPHNGALQLWLELGLPGALLGAALALSLGFAAARAARPAVAAAALAAGAVTAALSFGAWQEWWVGAELMAAAALAGLPRQEGR